MVRAGWVMTGIVALFLLGASTAPKLAGAPVAVDALVALGWPPQHVLLIGLIELACVIHYVIPRTGPLGAVLLTGLLGGAMASHLRAGSPLLSHTLFSIYLGVFAWAALVLRDGELRALLARRAAPRTRSAVGCRS